MAILSFSSNETKMFFETGLVPKKAGWAKLRAVAARKLDMIDYAVKLSDLRVPPNNRLEKLSGNLKGFYSIRINDQWRVVFQWTPNGAESVDIVDYH